MIVTVINTLNPASNPTVATGTATVSDAALTAGTEPNVTAFAGDPTGTVLLGTFSDANPSATAADFTSATITWGDSTPNTSGTVQADPNGGFDVYGSSHTYAAVGSDTITVTVTDDGGQTVTLSGSATVVAPTTSITATEGVAYNDVVATFSGDGTQATGATITWGDGNQSSGTITAGQGSFTVSGTNTYAEEGVYPLTVTVTMNGSGNLTAGGPATVGDAALTVLSAPNVSGLPGQPLSTTGDVLLMHYADANSSAPLSDFSATVAWGDGSTSDGTVQTDPGGGFDVLANHTYATPGVYTITTKVVDVDGSTAQASATATIGNLIEGQNSSVSVSVPVGTLQVRPDTVYNATVTWGDGSTTTNAAVLNAAGTALVVGGAHVYQEEGPYTVSATVTDLLGNTSTGSTAVTVSDAAVTGWGTPVTAVAGATATYQVGGFLDLNQFGPASDFTGNVTIAWGDNTQSAATLQANGSGGYLVSGSHSYSTAGSDTITVTIDDAGGTQTSFTTTATVVAPWSVVDQSGQRANDPQSALLSSVGEATVDLNQGGLRVSQALDFDQSPGTSVGGDPALVYNSATVSALPVIQWQVATDPNAASAASAQVTLTFNGVQQSAVTIPITGATAGAVVMLAAQVATPVTTTGLYNWSATINFYDSGSNLLGTATPSGTAAVVARDSSALGAGWGLDGVSQLVAVTGGVLWVTGQGDSRLFTGSGGTFTSPAEDFGTLVQNGDNTYTYTAVDGTTTNFNAQGYQTSVVTRDGQAITYTYDGQNRLSGVLAPDGGSTTLTYDSTTGLLDSITEPGGRVVQLGHDASGNLTTILDAVGFSRTLGYNTLHQLTSDQWAPLSAAFGYDSTTGLLNDVNQGLGSNWTVASAAAQGLSSAVVGWAQATLTDGLDHSTGYQLDLRGRVLDTLDPTDALTTYERDAHGDATLALDPMLRPTFSTYDSFGDLLQATYADGSYDQYTYDSVYHQVLTTNNALGEKTSNSYNTTGDLLSSTDAVGNKTTYAWANGLLQSTTDPLNHTTYDFYDADRRLVETADAANAPTFYQYDSNGNPSKTLDALLRPTYTVYNADNELVSTLDANYDLSTTSYAADGQVTGDTNARGFSESTSYDVRGLATSSTDYAQATTQYQYDAGGNLTKVIDARGNSTAYAYDADNRLASTTDALNNVVDTRDYDLDGHLVTELDALQQSTGYVYDVLGQVMYSSDPLGRTTYNFYDLAGNLIRQTDPLGLSTQTFFDADNRAMQQVDARGNASSTTYDAGGNVSATTSAAGLKTTYQYDPDNRPTSTTDPSGATTQTQYNDVGDAVATIDPRGKVWQQVFDVLDRVIARIDPLGNKTQTAYDEVGNVVATIDARGFATSYNYDADNRLLRAQDAAHDVSLWSYDPVGNQVSSTDAKGATTLTWYDADNRPVQTEDADGHFWTTVYNAVSAVVASIDGSNDVTRDSYDGDGEETGTVNPDGSTTQDGFNADGWQMAVTDASGNRTQMLYNPDGVLVSTIDPLGNATLFVYDKDNRLVSYTDRLGRKTAYTYDGAGRVLTQTRYNADKTVADTLTYTYDKAGNVLTASNGYGTYTYTYDDAGRVLTQKDPFGLTLTYGYDQNSNVTSIQDSLGGTVTSVYDNVNRLSSRQFSGGGMQARLDVAYTADSQVASLTRYGDTAGQNKVGVTLNSFDAAGNVTEIKHQNGSGATLQDFQYSYDASNRLSSETDNGTATPYSYDPAGQLTVAGGAAYSYDATGNRTMSGYQTGPNNLLVSDGTWSYQYDAEGNLALKTNLSTRETWAYSYDNANKLTSAVHKDGSGNLVSQVTLKYDVLGQLVEEDVYTQSTGQTVVSKYAYDVQGNAWADLNGSNLLVARRLYLDGPNAAFARIDSTNGVVWYLDDHLGSVRALADQTGALLDAINYDAWGNVVSESLPGMADRFRWASMQYDAALGDYYDQARRYNPATGRFESEDPIRFAAGDANLSRYTFNGPTNGVDPSGLFRWWLDDWLDAHVGAPLGEAYNNSAGFRGTVDAVDTIARTPIEAVKAVAHPKQTANAIRDRFLQVYETALAGGENTVGAATLGVLVLVADAVGVTNLNEAYVGKELITNRPLDEAERVKKSIVGGFQLATTALGVSQLPAVVPAVKAVPRVVKAVPRAIKAVPRAIKNAPKVFGKLKNRVRGKGAPGRLVNCFPPDTLVGTETGLRRIGQIGAGERVWGYDFQAGVWRLCVVECRHDANYDGPLVTLHADAGQVTATAFHPFWVIQGDDLANRPTPRHVGPDEDQGGSLPGRWVNSHDLREGDVVFLKGHGPTTLRRVVQRHEQTPVCNLTVEGLHTFAVGEMQVLVHNTSGSQPPLRSIHPDSSLSKASLDFWGRKSTPEIIDSLRPGQAEALRAYPDGRIANGNTRIKILRERGVDVDALPREIHNP